MSSLGIVLYALTGKLYAESKSTVKKHVQETFDKLGVETRGAAAVRALEVLNTGGSSTR